MRLVPLLSSLLHASSILREGTEYLVPKRVAITLIRSFQSIQPHC